MILLEQQTWISQCLLQTELRTPYEFSVAFEVLVFCLTQCLLIFCQKVCWRAAQRLERNAKGLQMFQEFHQFLSLPCYKMPSANELGIV